MNDEPTIGDIEAAHATIEDLEASYPTISDLNGGGDTEVGPKHGGWQRGLVESQSLVVAGLQNRLRSQTDERAPTGHVKDIAIALGVAVDKLAVLVTLPVETGRPVGDVDSSWDATTGTWDDGGAP